MQQNPSRGAQLKPGFGTILPRTITSTMSFALGGRFSLTATPDTISVATRAMAKAARIVLAGEMVRKGINFLVMSLLAL